MTGMSSIQPLRDMQESTSKPSAPGMTMSSNTMEMPLPCCSRHAMPASPQSASRISYWSLSISLRMTRFISESSTTNSNGLWNS